MTNPKATFLRAIGCVLLGTLSACGDSGSSPSDSSGVTNSTATQGLVANGAISLTAANYAAVPSSTAVVLIHRTGNFDGAASINYSTVNGTATAGNDFETTKGTVSWSDGDSSVKTVTVPVTATAKGKRFSFQLSNIQGQADFGSPSSATVAVSGSNDTAGTGPAQSPSETMIPANATQLIDSGWNTWTLKSGVVYQQASGAASATPAGYSANVVLVLYFNGTVYQENASCNWWSWNGTGWIDATNPDSSITPPCAAGTAAPTPAAPATTPVAVAPSGNFGIRVSGNKLVSTKDGSVVQLRGANVADLGQLQKGSNAWPNFGIGGEPNFVSMADWHMNVVRFTLNEANWLRYVCAGIQPDPQNNHKAAIIQAVSKANAAGLYVILDLHWAAPGTTYCPTGQGPFADADHSVAFWASVAETFKGNPAVMFELFNEPFGTNIYSNWNGRDAVLLRDGGTMPSFIQQNSITGALDNHGMTWQVAGHNQMIAAIRATGATNVILASPIGWAGEIQWWMQYMPTDPAKQLAAAWHVYGNHNMTAAQAVLNGGYPIVITETNGMLGGKGSNGIDNQLFNWADAQNVGYVWWAWTPYSPTDDLTVHASCSTAGAFPLTGSDCAVPTVPGKLFKAGLACAVTSTQNCW